MTHILKQITIVYWIFSPKFFPITIFLGSLVAFVFLKETRNPVFSDNIHGPHSSSSIPVSVDLFSKLL